MEMEPLKVCYFVKWYPRLSQTFILHELLELQRQGIDLTIVALKAADEEIVSPQYQALHAPIYYLPPASSIQPEAWVARSCATYADQASTLGFETLKGVLSPRDYTTLVQTAMMAPFIKRLGIQHIHAHFATWAATAAAFVSRLTGIPYSFTAHARDIYHQNVKAQALAEKIAGAQFVITVSEYNKQYLEALLHAAGKSGCVHRLYNGIDLQRFQPVVGAREPDLVVGVGRLVPKKGFAYLIEACRLLKAHGRRVRCAIIGDGEERTALEKQAACSGLAQDVVLLGAQPQAEVMRMLQKAALFVLPCVVGEDGDRDGLPTVLLEAMALGTPAISTRISGIPEIITHGRTGLLVEERDAVALAGAIESLLDNGNLQEELRQAALAKVRDDFNLAENVRRLKQYFLTENEIIA